METDVKLVHIPEAVSRGMEEVWWEVGGWGGRRGRGRLVAVLCTRSAWLELEALCISCKTKREDSAGPCCRVFGY